MTEQLRKKVKIELESAFKYFGEKNKSTIAQKVASSIAELSKMMMRAAPEIVDTDVGKYDGYLINIVSKFDDQTGTALAVNMFISSGEICYILNSSKQVENEKNGFAEYISEINELMILEDIDPKQFQ